MNVILAGLALGLAGSAHCAAMCGPLVAAVAPRGRRAIVHHAGRGTVYVLLGTGAGLAGAGMSAAGLGRWWAYFLAIVLLLNAGSRLAMFGGVSDALGPVGRTARSVSRAIRSWALRRPVAGAFGVGAINGLLPCGLVYAATAVSAGLGGPGEAAAFMAAFAMGSTPALAAGSLSLDWLRRRAPVLNRLTPLLLVILAALLIARGWQAPGATGHLH